MPQPFLIDKSALARRAQPLVADFGGDDQARRRAGQLGGRPERFRFGAFGGDLCADRVRLASQSVLPSGAE
jgi:hypothetical protein